MKRKIYGAMNYKLESLMRTKDDEHLEITEEDARRSLIHVVRKLGFDVNDIGATRLAKIEIEDREDLHKEGIVPLPLKTEKPLKVMVMKLEELRGTAVILILYNYDVSMPMFIGIRNRDGDEKFEKFEMEPQYMMMRIMMQDSLRRDECYELFENILVEEDAFGILPKLEN